MAIDIADARSRRARWRKWADQQLEGRPSIGDQATEAAEVPNEAQLLADVSPADDPLESLKAERTQEDSSKQPEPPATVPSAASDGSTSQVQCLYRLSSRWISCPCALIFDSSSFLSTLDC